MVQMNLIFPANRSQASVVVQSMLWRGVTNSVLTDSHSQLKIGIMTTMAMATVPPFSEVNIKFMKSAPMNRGKCTQALPLSHQC